MDFSEYKECVLCPRECRVDRNNEEKGFCGERGFPRVGRAALHMWEEPCVSGKKGSGTVFFSGCSLRCCYCQNHALSRDGFGIAVDAEDLSQTYLELERQGAHNINLVTAEHFAPHIHNSIVKAREKGLQIPVILNSSGYVSDKTLEILKNDIDVFLVDFKYMNPVLGKKYSMAEDYPFVAKKALDKMVKIAGKPTFDDEGIIKRGVIVRHLCLPENTVDSKNVIKYVYETYGQSVILSIMSQYTPQINIEKFDELKRKLTEEEYENILDFCLEIGIEEAFIQEGESASESFIPEFNGEGVKK